MVRGETLGAIAMSEPAAGSDLQGIKTTALRDGDDIVINGSKVFITNGQLADLVIVVSKTNPDAGAKGPAWSWSNGPRRLQTRPQSGKIGWKAQDTSELSSTTCGYRRPIAGGENRGFIQLVEQLPQERLLVAMRSTSAMEPR